MSIEKIINEAWEIKDQINQDSDKTLKDAINQVISDLDYCMGKLFTRVTSVLYGYCIFYGCSMIPGSTSATVPGYIQ